MDKTNRRWMDLAAELAEDTHPGAVFLRTNLIQVRRSISDSPSSELLLVPAEYKEKAWQGAAGVTIACGCVHVQFMYIRPPHRNTKVIELLFKEIAAIGKKFCYGYVMVYCPLVDGLESLHSFCAGLAHAKINESAPVSGQVRIYSIHKDVFESSF